MSRNAAGGIKRLNKEWGGNRKPEAAVRGLNNAARRETITEQVEDMIDPFPELEATRPDVSDLAVVIARHIFHEADMKDPKDVQRYMRLASLEDEVQEYVRWLTWLCQ